MELAELIFLTSKVGLNNFTGYSSTFNNYGFRFYRKYEEAESTYLQIEKEVTLDNTSYCIEYKCDNEILLDKKDISEGKFNLLFYETIQQCFNKEKVEDLINNLSQKKKQ